MSRGGTDELGNLQFLCQECNLRKGALTHKEVRILFSWFKKVLARRAAHKFSTNEIAPVSTVKKQVTKPKRPLRIRMVDTYEELIDPITGEVYEIPKGKFKIR